jgi:hypothetical protein
VCGRQSGGTPLRAGEVDIQSADIQSADTDKVLEHLNDRLKDLFNYGGMTRVRLMKRGSPRCVGRGTLSA